VNAEVIDAGDNDYSKLPHPSRSRHARMWEATRQRKYLCGGAINAATNGFHRTFPRAQVHVDGYRWFETAGKGVIHSYVVVVQPIVELSWSSAVRRPIIELDDQEEDGTSPRRRRYE